MTVVEQSRRKRRPPGELRRSVLEVVAATGPCTVRDVHAQLQDPPAACYTTVLTVMKRLYDTGLLERSWRGKAGVYRLAQSNDRSEAGRLAEMLLARFGPVAVSEFVTHAREHPHAYEQLRAAVALAEVPIKVPQDDAVIVNHDG